MLLLQTPAAPELQSWWTSSSSWFTDSLQLHPGSHGARGNGCAPLHAFRAFWWDTHAQRQGLAAASPTRPPSSHSDVGRASGLYQCVRHGICTRQAQPNSSKVWVSMAVSDRWKILFYPARKLWRFPNAAEHKESQDKEKSKFQKSNIKIKFCCLQMPYLSDRH